MEQRTFGGLLRDARQRSLLTLEGLAEASGVSVRAISDMERGHSLPRQATLRELMDALTLDEDQRRALVRSATRRAKGTPRQLPPDLAVFRGRDEALTAVRGYVPQAAAQGGHPAIAVVGGMAGVGKTTLAVHWAHQMADSYPDGQLYVNLRGFEEAGQPLDPGDALRGFLSALGVPAKDIPAGIDELSAAYRAQTASRRMIVVLDNARDAEQVEPLLPVSAGCLAIVTSRSRLSGPAVTEGASLINLDVWTPAEALAALAARIGAERCAAEPDAAARLVELCGHLPLAVAVFGAQLVTTPRMPLRLAVRELEETRLDVLSADDRRSDVRTVFSWSYRALPPDTARFFRHLTVHPGTALSAGAAASLAGVEPAAARRHLRDLTTASLLSRDADGLYVLHDLVRAYGGELMERERDDRFGAETRLLHYLRHNAHVANEFLDTRPTIALPEELAPGVPRLAIADRTQALDWFRQEESTLAAVLRAIEDPRLLRYRTLLTQDWQSYFAVMGRWAEQISAQRSLDAALVLDDPVAIARHSASLASALAQTGRIEEADEQADLMLGQLHRLPPAERAAAERSIGWVRGRQERYDEALRHARRALELFRELGDDSRVARELNAVGWYRAMLGDHRAAIATCQEAIPMLRQAGNRRDEAATWDSIGYARQHLGDPAAAIADYRESLRLYGEVLDSYNQADVLDHLAFAQTELGEAAQARESWRRAAELLTGIDSPRAAEMWTKAQGPLPPADEAP